MTVWDVQPPQGGGGRVSLQCQGSKNAALPLLFAAAAVEGESCIQNVPAIGDVDSCLRDLHHVGVQMENGTAGLRIQAHDINSAPNTQPPTTRYSVLLLSVLLRRCGYVRVGQPGGCALVTGGRPIDYHLAGFRHFGVDVHEDPSGTYAVLKKDKPGSYRLPFPSVGATQNLLIFCALGSGQYQLRNCAEEPEVHEVARFLCACGAKIKHVSAGAFDVAGEPNGLRGCRWPVIPDRVEAATLLIAGLLSRRDVFLSNCEPQHLVRLLRLLTSLDASYDVPKRGVVRILGDRWNPVQPLSVVAKPYPGMPTDMLPLLAALALALPGVSTLQDPIFPARTRHVDELARCGARVASAAHGTVSIQGGMRFTGGTGFSSDIRCGASLALASAKSLSGICITNIGQIQRGYDGLDAKLTALGWQVLKPRSQRSQLADRPSYRR